MNGRLFCDAEEYAWRISAVNINAGSCWDYDRTAVESHRSAALGSLVRDLRQGLRTMSYQEAAWERAMTVQEMLSEEIVGELPWLREAEIVGWSPRTVRRDRKRYQAYGGQRVGREALQRRSKRGATPASSSSSLAF